MLRPHDQFSVDLSGVPLTEDRFLVVVPTYNEAANVIPLIAGIETARFGLPFEVLVVDDNSPDGTGGLIRSFQTRRPWLHVMERRNKQGLGSAYRAGFAWAMANGYGYVAEMDADLSHDPAVLPVLFAAARRGEDVVIGSRYVGGGGSVGWPVARRLLSRGANLYARMLLSLPVRDATSGFRVYSRRAVKLLLDVGTNCDGYGFQVEGVTIADRAGLRIAERPIVFRDRSEGSSKMSSRVAVEAARRCLVMAVRPPDVVAAARSAGSRQMATEALALVPSLATEGSR